MAIKIRDLTLQDIPYIVEIANTELGNNYFGSDICKLLENEDAIFKIAESTRHETIAFCYSYIIPANTVISELRTTKTAHNIIVKKAGVLKTIAVKEGYKRSGIGQLFVENLMASCQNKNIEIIYCVAWKSASATNISGLLSKFNFKILEEIPNYWTKESLEKKYSCPECGDNGCYCSAVVYYKILDPIV